MPFEVTNLVVILILLAGGIFYEAVTLRERRPLRNALLIVCLAPALFVAVEGGTEAVTCDEINMIPEISNLHRVSGRQWRYGNYRTSLAVTGNIIQAVHAPLAKNSSQLKILTKSIHWLLGIICLAGIFWTVSQQWVPKNLLIEFFLIYSYSALLLPTNILALKVANYDMFAMFLGIWGLLCCLVGCEKVEPIGSTAPSSGASKAASWAAFLAEIFLPDGGWTLSGIVLIALAAQEKQIATPLLSLALVLSLLMRLRRRRQEDWWLAVQLGVWSIVMVVIVSLTFAAIYVWQPPE